MNSIDKGLTMFTIFLYYIGGLLVGVTSGLNAGLVVGIVAISMLIVITMMKGGQSEQ